MVNPQATVVLKKSKKIFNLL